MHDFLAFDKSIKNVENTESNLEKCLSVTKKSRVKDRFGKFVQHVVDNRNGAIETRLFHNDPYLFDPIRHNQLLV